MKKLGLYFDTIKYLKCKQLVYQTLYRVLKVKPLASYVTPERSINTRLLAFSDYLPTLCCADTKNRFSFLNRQVTFAAGVDWAYAANGKLWNYNLQYGYYLLQEDIHMDIRLEWLKALHQSLYTGTVALEPYPVSVRAMNSIRFICRHTLTDSALLSAVHGELNFLSGRVEYHLLANHVLENAFALLMGGAFFQQPEWHNMGREILLRELEEQVLGDGAHYELSPMYHQIILYRVLELIDWYQNYENPDNLLLERVCSKASLMLSWLRNMSFSNNDIPHVNDSAPSIAYDTASLLNYAASLQLEPMASVQLADSGYRKFDSGSYECVVDAAAIGPSYQAGHGHADALSFILYYKGSPVLVEAGTSTYEPGPRREYERSTGAHNTIEIQGANQSKVWGSFRVGYRANTTVVREEAGLLIAEHDGYVNRFGITHRRTFEFEASQITITDELLGEESMAGIAYFHLHPSVQYSLHHHMVSIPNICTVVFSDAVEYVEAGTYQFAEGFNSCCPSGVIKVAFKGKIITRIKFI